MSSKNIIRLVVVLVVLIVVIVAAVAIFTPLIGWPFGSDDVLIDEQPKPTESIEMNKIILTEDEIQDTLGAVLSVANLSDDIYLEYMNVRLDNDRMLVSTKGKALGIQPEIEDLEVRFQGKKVYASGPVKAYGVSPVLELEVDIDTIEGKPGLMLPSSGCENCR